MKHHLRSFAALLATSLALFGVTSARATGYVFLSENRVTLQTFDGGPVPLIETVALGSFTSGFTPAESNTSFWNLHWLTGENSAGGVNGHEWIAGFTLNETSAIGAGARLYLWVTYTDPEANQLGTLLLTDPAWVSVVNSALDSTYYYHDFSPDTSAIVGTLDVAGGITRLSFDTVIPEPAAIAILLGSGALALGVARRRCSPVR